MGVIVVLLVFVAIPGALCLWLLNWWHKVQARSMELRLLAEEGAVVFGRVHEIECRQRNRWDRDYYLSYAFTDRLGRTHMGRREIGNRAAQLLEAGEPIRVCYLPDSPEVNALDDMVVHMREASNDQVVSA